MTTSPNQDILATADRLFENQGFDMTTLDHIATTTGVSLAVLTESYTCKEQIALQLYHQLGEESLSLAQNLPVDTMANLYYQIIQDKIIQLDAHDETVSALFAAAMRPNACITSSDIAPGRRDPMMQACEVITKRATDTLASHDTDDMTIMLYSFHFLIVLFWLYDRTENKHATQMMVDFVRDLFKMTRPMLMMPFVGKSLSKLARILMLVFGGAKLVDDTDRAAG